MGIRSSKIDFYEDAYSLGLSSNEFNNIKEATTSLNLSDIHLIKSIRYLKKWDIKLTNNNVHLWRVYVKWGSTHII
jgi:hypothetical protein